MKKRFLVCIDSDGCAFDTMELKHKECFCPMYIRYFGLQAVSKYAREAWDFANLYSSYRGIHRLRALLKALEVLAPRKEVLERGFQVPTLSELSAYVEKGGLLSNAGLEEYLKEHPDSEEFRNILKWSCQVNLEIGKTVFGVPPFPHVRESLSRLSETADIVVVSATPAEALEREWAEHGLTRYLTAIKGQESGSKKEIIASLMGEYDVDKILMIGDAPGDRDAAHANGVLFYPICPDEEAASWKQFEEEYMDLFLSGVYAGKREQSAISYFEALLPTKPKWI
ncbi:MAG: HAD hydrolase-like protein [Clostridia bacterium]|nr:HAD hydrolase-like protein [Clostridia bacterium]